MLCSLAFIHHLQTLSHTMRDGQRFHHHRQHALVAPGVTGLIFTVDPNQVGKSIRELQLYLDRFQPMFEGQGDQEEQNSFDIIGAGSRVESSSAAPIASLLAAELAQFRKPSSGADPVETPQSKPRVKRNQVLFSVLETNCKGYLFINVPHSGPFIAAVAPSESLELTKKRPRDESSEDCAEQPTSPGGPLLDETVADRVSESSPAVRQLRLNDRVPKLVDAIFEELEAHPSRPVSRFTYRMYPCSISVCPVSGSMTSAVRELAAQIPPIPGRSAIKVAIHLNVKNNSNVDREKVKLRADLEGCLPQNRFLVLPLGRKGIELDGVFQLHVLHSTCCAGYAPSFTMRREYNVHDFGRQGDEET